MLKKLFILMFLSAFAYAEAPQDLIKLKGKWELLLQIQNYDIKTSIISYPFDLNLNNYTEFTTFDTIEGKLVYVFSDSPDDIPITCINDYDDIYIRSQYICTGISASGSIITLFINSTTHFDHRFSGEFAIASDSNTIKEEYDNQTTRFFMGVKKKNPVIISIF